MESFTGPLHEGISAQYLLLSEPIFRYAIAPVIGFPNAQGIQSVPVFSV